MICLLLQQRYIELLYRLVHNRRKCGILFSKFDNKQESVDINIPRSSFSQDRQSDSSVHFVLPSGSLDWVSLVQDESVDAAQQPKQPESRCQQKVLHHTVECIFLDLMINMYCIRYFHN